MKIAILNETATHEKRTSISLDSLKKYISLGAEVHIESGAGEGSGVGDAVFKDAGATIAKNAKTACADADIVLCVQAPSDAQLADIPNSALLIGMLSPMDATTDLDRYNRKNLSTFAMELLPRISRAQSMDVLSSQSNLAGYRAVIDACQYFGKVIPMMMTSAGTVPPAKVLVLGAGVAGLQAIATAKRLGAVVSAFDVRPAVKEQVQSLGAKFIEVAADTSSAETAGGYAKEMSDDYKQKQSQLIHETLKSQDICISTALIPGKEAPELITEAMVKDMKPGSIIVDLAVASGGNCKLSQMDEVIEAHGVHVMGYSNMPSRAATDATPLYARNLYNFISTLMINKEKALDVQWDDVLIAGTLLTKDGEIASPSIRALRGIKEPTSAATAEE